MACGGGGGGGGGGGSPGGGTGEGGSAVTLGSDVYPLATGDRRTARVVGGASTGLLRHERVGALTTVAGVQAYAVHADDGSVDYQQRTASGIVSVPGPGSDALSLAAGPVEFLRFGLAAGASAVLFDRTIGADVNGDGLVDSVDLRVTSTFIGNEAVQTAAGAFGAASHVRSLVVLTVRFAGLGSSTTVNTTSDDWYASGVGLVRSQTVTTSPGSLTETEQQDLVAYGVGSRRSESVPPVVQTLTPAAAAVVSPDTAFALVLSEPLDPLSLDGADGIALFDATGAVVASRREIGNGGLRLDLRPVARLPDGSYELRTGAGVTDLAGNPLAASRTSYSVDTRGPRVVGSTPADGSSDVPWTGSITLRFDEPVFAAAGSAPMLALEQDARTTYLPATVQGRDITAVLPTPLQRNTGYSVSLGSLLTDAGGNTAAFARIAFRTDPGPLSRPQRIDPAIDITALLVADVDDDGRPDLVYAGQRIGTPQSEVGVRRRQADGTLAAPQRLATLSSGGICQALSLAVADLDGDGRTDIAVRGCGAPVTVLLRQPDGSHAVESAALDLFAWHIETLDVDGDGRAELVGVSPSGFRFWRRTGPGAWTTVAIAASPANGLLVVTNWRLTDLDRDGRADLVWIQSTPDNMGWELAWSMRQGAGFGPVQRQALPPSRNAAPMLTAGDLNGDGRPDLVLRLTDFDASTLLTTVRLLVLRQSATGSFDPVQTLASASGLGSAAVGDVNGDGRTDLVITADNGSQLLVYLQGTDGLLEAGRAFESSYGQFRDADALALLDANSDGRVDVAVGNDLLLGRVFGNVWPLATAPVGSAQLRSAAPGVLSGRAGVRALSGLQRVFKAQLVR